MTTPDYSSATYWSRRFDTESSFEWLGRSDAVLAALDPVIDSLLLRHPDPSPSSSSSSPSAPSSSPTLRQTSKGDKTHKALQIVHFGCGTSTLGKDLSAHLTLRNVDSRVMDADYVASSLPLRGEDDGDIPLISLDALDPDDLAAKSPERGWDMVLDKSTADAISCGPDLLPTSRASTAENGAADGTSDEDEDREEDMTPPLYRLCANLASVTREGGKWVCISYSSSRFDHLPFRPAEPMCDTKGALSSRQSNCNGTNEEEAGAVPSWIVRSKSLLAGGFNSDGVVEKRIPDGQGGERVIWEPETGAWVYILERV